MPQVQIDTLLYLLESVRLAARPLTCAQPVMPDFTWWRSITFHVIFDEFIMRGGMGPGPDDRHFAPRDVEQLRKLVNARPAKPGADAGHCGGYEVGRWGRANGRPRYRCKECRKTFGPLTGTPLGWITLQGPLDGSSASLDERRIRRKGG